MNAADAAQLPVFAGCALVGLYVCFKYLDAAWVNFVVRGYFCAAGTGAVATGLTPVLSRAPGGSTALFTLPAVPYVLAAPLPVTLGALGAFLCGAGAAAWYALTGSWASNNALGFAFCIAGIALINLGSVPVGALLLGGLFAYDIVMVFGTGALLGANKVSIMEEVATRVDGPIKLLFPLAGADALGKRPYSMLGLGDILVPGAFLALLVRFDDARAVVAGAAARGDVATPYFNCGLLAYTAGLIVTTISMHTYDTAQPALLYLVPAVLGATAVLALARGEFAALWAFSEDAVPEAAEVPSKAAEAPAAAAEPEVQDAGSKGAAASASGLRKRA